MSKRSIVCANPACKAEFVSARPNARYCSGSCAARDREESLRRARAEADAHWYAKHQPFAAHRVRAQDRERQALLEAHRAHVAATYGATG